MNFSDIAILEIKYADYCYTISGISKSEAVNLMQNINSTEKSGTLWTFIKTKYQETSFVSVNLLKFLI